MREEMSTIVKKAWGYRYAVLIILWLVYIINYFDRMAVLTFLPFIQKDLNLTPVEVGQLASVFFFAYAAAQIELQDFLQINSAQKRLCILPLPYLPS